MAVMATETPTDCSEGPGLGNRGPGVSGTVMYQVLHVPWPLQLQLHLQHAAKLPVCNTNCGGNWNSS